MAHKVFICHSSQNKQVADAACAALESHRIACWIAPRDILAGEEYGKAIIDALAGCQIVLLIFSRDANDSPQVRREIERAVSKGKIIVPFRIEQVQPSDAMEYALGNTHWLDAMTPPMEKSLANLCATISKLIERQDSDPLWRPKEEVAIVAPIEATAPPIESSSVIVDETKSVTPPRAVAEPVAVLEPEPAAPRGWGRIAGVLAAVVLAAGGVFAYMHRSDFSASESVAVTETPQPSAPAPGQPAVAQQTAASDQPAPQDNAPPPAALPEPSSTASAGKPAKTAAPVTAPATAPVPTAAETLTSAEELTPAEMSNNSPAEKAEKAKRFYDARHFLKAFPMAKQSCAENNAESCYLLGNMYVGGFGVASDPKAGAGFIEKACHAAVPGACGTLGVLYASGDGVPQDHPKAVSLLNNSCDSGNAQDCFTLGKIFSEALYGFNRQPPKAQMYFHKACDGKVEQACNRIRPDVPAYVPPDGRLRRTPPS